MYIGFAWRLCSDTDKLNSIDDEDTHVGAARYNVSGRTTGYSGACLLGYLAAVL
jgi:hypothetical protein